MLYIVACVSTISVLRSPASKLRQNSTSVGASSGLTALPSLLLKGGEGRGDGMGGRERRGGKGRKVEGIRMRRERAPTLKCRI